MQTYFLNPEFIITREKDSFIIARNENEYLLDIRDPESQNFMERCIHETSFSSKNLPLQFEETFQALVVLDVFKMLKS